METAGVRLVVEGAGAFESSMRSASGSMEDFNATGSRIGAGLGMLGGVAAGVGVAVGGALVAGFGAAAAAGLSMNNAMEQAQAQINAFTKDQAKTAEILDMVRERAAQTPFAFQEMATAAGALIPVSKAAGMELEGVLEIAEVLAASNPAEGLEGAAFALREAVSGDFVSLVERFNLPRDMINRLKEEGLPNIEIVRRALQEMGFDYDLVAGLAATAQGRMSTFKDTLQSIAATATQPIFDIFSATLGQANEKLAELEPQLTAAAAAIGQALAPAAQAAADALLGLITGGANLIALFSEQGLLGGLATLGQSLMQWGVEMGQALLAWIADAASRAGPAIMDFASSLLGGMQNALPQISATLTGASDVLWSWIGGALPNAISAIIQFIAGLVGTLANLAPTILGAVSAAGNALWQWIAAAAPKALQALISYGQTILTTIVAVAPGVLSSVSRLREAIVNWIAEALPQLGTNLGKLAALLITKIGEWIAVAAPKLAELGMIFLRWIATDVLPNLPGQLLRIGMAILQAIGNFLSQVGPPLAELGRKFISWIATDVLPGLPGALAQIGSMILSGLATLLGQAVAAAQSLGSGIINGIIAGAQAMVGALTGAVRGIVDGAINAAKSMLGIRSPSTVARDQIGYPIGAGIAEGIRAAMTDIRESIEWIATETLNHFRDMGERINAYMTNLLGSMAGLQRGQVGALHAIQAIAEANQRAAQEVERATQRVRDEERKLADMQQQRSRQQEEAQRKLADLAEERARMEQTAALHFDPAERQRAMQRIAEINQQIADEERRAAERDEQANRHIAEQQQRIASVRGDEAEARRRQEAINRANTEAWLAITQARQQAAQMEQTDPQAAADFLALRLQQIEELRKLQERRGLASWGWEQQMLDEQIRRVQQAQALDLERFQRQATEAARRRITDLAGRETADGFVEAIRERVEAQGRNVADALLEAIRASIRAGGFTGGVPGAPPPMLSVTINGATLTPGQINDALDRLLQTWGRQAAALGRTA